MTSVVDRLVLQINKFHDCEKELLREKTLLQNKVAQRDSLQAELDKLKTRLKSIESVRVSLEKSYKEAIEEHTETQKRNEEERAQVAEELRTAIAKVTAFSEEVKLVEEKALQENRSLNEQLQAYTSCQTAGQGKYAEIMATRDAELKKFEEARDAGEALILQLEARLAEEDAALAKEREEHDELKAKADEWLERSNNVYDELQKAKSFLERSRNEQERLRHKVGLMENELRTLLAKVDKVKKESENERKKAENLGEKIAACKIQTEKILTVKAMLEKNAQES